MVANQPSIVILNPSLRSRVNYVKNPALIKPTSLTTHHSSLGAGTYFSLDVPYSSVYTGLGYVK